MYRRNGKTADNKRIYEMKYLLVIAFTFILIGCKPENHLHKNSGTSVELWLWQRTGKFYLISRCGYFTSETSRYVITLPQVQDKYLFSEISVSRDGSTLMLSNGYVQIEKPNIVFVNLFEYKNGKAIALNVNGKHKFKSDDTTSWKK